MTKSWTRTTLRKPENLPCPRCLELYERGTLRGEMVQPVPVGVMAPLALSDGKPCCYDCQAADTMLKLGVLSGGRDKIPRRGTPDFDLVFGMARIAVGNDRADQYRLPGAKMGIVAMGYMKPSQPGDFERHVAWLDEHNIQQNVLVQSIPWDRFAKQFPTASSEWDAFAIEHAIADLPILLHSISINGRPGIMLQVLDDDGVPHGQYGYGEFTCDQPYYWKDL